MEIRPVSEMNLVKQMIMEKQDVSLPVTAEKDKVQLSAEYQKKAKFEPVQKLKNIIASVKKTYVSFTGYTKALTGGIVKGGIIGSVVFGVLKAIDFARSHGKENVKKLPNALIISAAVVAGLVKIGTTLFKSSLNINEIKANIDHRYHKNLHN